jgi:hypothetical protein
VFGLGGCAIINRCDQLVEKHLGGIVVQINGKPISVQKGLIAKSHGLPELEVADFVMHAAACPGARCTRWSRSARCAAPHMRSSSTGASLAVSVRPIIFFGRARVHFLARGLVRL